LSNSVTGGITLKLRSYGQTINLIEDGLKLG
jgi:hypothetical protein